MTVADEEKSLPKRLAIFQRSTNFLKEILHILPKISSMNLFDEIYIRNIYKRNNVRNQGELEDLLNILSSAIGSLTNPEKLRK